MLYEFKLHHNAAEVTKNICCAKVEGAVDLSVVTRWLKKFLSSCTNLADQARSSRTKSLAYKAVLQAKSKEGEWLTERIRRARHLTIQRSSSPSKPQPKHLKLPNCASHCQNIAKLFTHPINKSQVSWGCRIHRLQLCRGVRPITTGVFVLFGLVWFYGISTIVGYLMPNPFLYI